MTTNSDALARIDAALAGYDDDAHLGRDDTEALASALREARALIPAEATVESFDVGVTDEDVDAARVEFGARTNNRIQPTRGTIRAALEAADASRGRRIAAVGASAEEANQ
jgi:hypothetical protein